MPALGRVDFDGLRVDVGLGNCRVTNDGILGGRGGEGRRGEARGGEGRGGEGRGGEGWEEELQAHTAKVMLELQDLLQ